MSYSTDLLKMRRLAQTGMARTIREAAGLSLTEVARSAGVDRTTVFRWEHAERRPSGDAAIRYLRMLEELQRA